MLIDALTCVTKSTRWSDAGILPSIIRLSTCSTDQATSPSCKAPTVRPLPLSVWNERLTSAKASVFVRLLDHKGKAVRITANTSVASSMKISLMSSSIKLSVVVS